MKEQWRPIPGWEELYEVSDLGRVRSLPRKVWSTRGRGFWSNRSSRILLPTIVRGYERVTLQVGGHLENVAVHRLVLLAFISPCPEGMEACHFDDDRRNNALTNLRWDTKSANCKDRTRNGGSLNALKTHCPQGHPYSPENTRHDAGSRKCRKCLSRRAVAYKRRIREERKAAA